MKAEYSKKRTSNVPRKKELTKKERYTSKMGGAPAAITLRSLGSGKIHVGELTAESWSNIPSITTTITWHQL